MAQFDTVMENYMYSTWLSNSDDMDLSIFDRFREMVPDGSAASRVTSERISEMFPGYLYHNGHGDGIPEQVEETIDLFDLDNWMETL